MFHTPTISLVIHEMWMRPIVTQNRLPFNPHPLMFKQDARKRGINRWLEC